MIVTLKNPRTQQMKQVKVGFSWTTLFFGSLPSLFRMDWINFLIMTGAAFITMGISWLVFPFIYNKMYVNRLIKEGFLPSSKQDQDILLNKGLTLPEIIA